MKRTNKSKGKSKPKDEYVHNVMQDDEIEELIQKITLKRPRNKFTQFYIRQNELRERNGQSKIAVNDADGRVELMKKWNKLSDKEKAEYETLYEQEKTQFKKDMETVRHYLFKDYNENSNNTPTAYRLFLNEKIREGYDKDTPLQDIKKSAREEWNTMSLSQKQEYVDKMKETKSWFENAKKLKRPTILSLFVRKTFDECRLQNKELPNLTEVAKRWKKVKPDEKRRLQEMVDEIMQQRKEQRDIYELVNGIKPKKPAGAYRLFMLDLVEQKKFRDFRDTHEQWGRLSKAEKDEYLKKSHRIHVAYRFKMIMYEKRVRKMMPKRPPNAFGLYLHEKRGKAFNGDSAIAYWKEQWDRLPEKEREAYERRREEKMERYKKKKLLFESKIFDMPMRPLRAYNFYIRDRVPDLAKEKSDIPVRELLKDVGREWQDGTCNGKKINKKLYEEYAKQDEKRYKREMEEFQKNGYYTDNKKLEQAKAKIEDEGKKSRSASKKRGGSTAKKKKGGSKSPSKGAKADARSKSNRKKK